MAVMLTWRRRCVRIATVVVAAGLGAGGGDRNADAAVSATVHDGPALALTDAVTVGATASRVLEITSLWNSAVQHLQTLLPGSTIV
ncbi:MAG: hypothetical protein ACRDRB_23910 [Pseudonocardiaceae bacterium]